jgi:hypothetical protein
MKLEPSQEFDLCLWKRRTLLPLAYGTHDAPCQQIGVDRHPPSEMTDRHEFVSGEEVDQTAAMRGVAHRRSESIKGNFGTDNPAAQPAGSAPSHASHTGSPKCTKQIRVTSVNLTLSDPPARSAERAEIKSPQRPAHFILQNPFLMTVSGHACCPSAIPRRTREKTWHFSFSARKLKGPIPCSGERPYQMDG